VSIEGLHVSFGITNVIPRSSLVDEKAEINDGSSEVADGDGDGNHDIAWRTHDVLGSSDGNEWFTRRESREAAGGGGGESGRRCCVGEMS